MVGLKKLKTYQFKDKATYNQLKSTLEGWCFFRQDNKQYFLKAPNHTFISSLVDTKLIKLIDEKG